MVLASMIRPLARLAVLSVLLLLTVIAPRAIFAAPNAAAADDFVIKVKTDNPGMSTTTQFTIPTTGTGYNYNVDCNNNGTNEATAQTGNYTCNYASAGTYTIRIKDNMTSSEAKRVKRLSDMNCASSCESTPETGAILTPFEKNQTTSSREGLRRRMDPLHALERQQRPAQPA